MSAYYKISGERLTGIADAIRAKKGTTAVFTPEQMAAEIESIAVGNDLPNAEDAFFGAISDAVEYGVMKDTTVNNTNSTTHFGYRFTAGVTIACIGIRAKFGSVRSNNRYLCLWDAETQTAINTLTVTSDVKNEWVEYLFDTPVNLLAGKRYVVSYRGNGIAEISGSVTFNPKLTNVEWVFGYNTGENGYPANTSALGCGVDIIFKEALTESVVTEYKVQAETMNDIANEVKRITIATGTMTPAQIITELSGVATQGEGSDGSGCEVIQEHFSMITGVVTVGSNTVDTGGAVADYFVNALGGGSMKVVAAALIETDYTLENQFIFWGGAHCQFAYRWREGAVRTATFDQNYALTLAEGTHYLVCCTLNYH